MALILDPDDVHRVLEEAPEPFAPAETLKRHTLSHFEPKVALISHGAERAQRRRLNEQALESDSPVHRMAESFLPVVQEEATGLLDQLRAGDGALRYQPFFDAWSRVVRRVVLGDSARDDTGLTELTEKLRARGNWAFLRAVDRDGRAALLDQVQAALDRAEPGSLAGFMGQQPQGPESEPVQQVPQWLFAFDPAGMATFRALALLVSHPDRIDAARQEIGEPRTSSSSTG